MNPKLPLVKEHPSIIAYCSQACPKKDPKQLARSGNPIPHTCTCFEPSLNDRKGLTLIGKESWSRQTSLFLFVRIPNAVDSEYNSLALSS
jgi:hypothetical protein